MEGRDLCLEREGNRVKHWLGPLPSVVFLKPDSRKLGTLPES